MRIPENREMTTDEGAATRASQPDPDPRQEPEAQPAESARPGPQAQQVAPDHEGLAAGGQATGAPEPPRLLEQDAANTYRARWDAIQAAFVDEPRQAVSGADTLVAEVMQRIAHSFAEQKSELEGRWSRGEVSTEDLRTTFQQYRAFFEVMLR